MIPGRRSRPPNHDPGGTGHGLERRSNEAERMSGASRTEQSEVCDDEASPPMIPGPCGRLCRPGAGEGETRTPCGGAAHRGKAQRSGFVPGRTSNGIERMPNRSPAKRVRFGEEEHRNE